MSNQAQAQARPPELLAPAGGQEQLEAALRFGADAVYVGGQRFGLRAFAGNFDRPALERAVRTAHGLGRRLYVTVNAFLYEQDLQPVAAYLRELEELGVDAAIVSDPAAVLLAREQAPGLPLHLSTQANTLNSRAAAFWHGQGVERVILARELTMEDLRAIRANTPKTLALEAFVHGAVCASYSGRCVLSNYLTGRDANQGACAQTCRWKYALVEEKRPGEYLPIVEDGRGTYLYSANDLCMIEHLAELLEAGISSFKIEGRMKTDYYVATVVSAYRRALDDALAGKPFDPELLRRASFASHRPYSTGFYFTRRPDSPPGSVQVQQGASYLAKVLEIYPDGRGLVEQRNKFLAGERLQLFGPGGYADFLAEDLRSPEGEPLSAAPHPKQRLTLPLPPQAQAGDYLVRIKEQP